MRRGGSLIGTIIIILILVAVVLFALPWIRYFNEINAVKRALEQTKNYVVSEARHDIDDGEIMQRFDDEIRGKVKEHFSEAFIITRLPENKFRFQYSYYNYNMIVPILKIKFKDIEEKIIEGKEFGI